MPNMINMKFTQFASIILTFVIITLLFSWKMAALFTIGIGFHELCHLWAARLVKLETDGFYLIPFIGGIAFIKDKYKTYRQQVFVMLMGPVGGSLVAVASAALFYLTKNLYFASAAKWLFLVNIFNLLPFSFLDGGQIMNAVTYSISDRFGIYVSTISTIIGIAIVGYLNPIAGGLILIFVLDRVLLDLKNLKAIEGDQPWLAEELWFFKPASLNYKEILLTILIYLVVFGGMVAWCYQLFLIPNSDISYIMDK